MTSRIRHEAGAWWEAAIRSMPGGIGTKLRRRYYPRWLGAPGLRLSVAPGVHVNGWRNITLGDGVSIGSDCRFEASSGTIVVGSGCGFNHGVWLGADHGAIEIGADVIVGPFTVMRAANHRFDRIGELAISKQGSLPGRIVIDDDVWIGAHVTITAGSRIGAHCVIAAGAVVRGTIPPYSLAGGIPAKVIRQLGPADRDSIEPATIDT